MVKVGGIETAKMYVVFDAADLMDVGARRLDDSLFQAPMRDRLDRWRKQRRAVLGVPRDVQIDLGVIVA